MVAGRGRNHAAPALVCRQLAAQIDSPSNLEMRMLANGFHASPTDHNRPAQRALDSCKEESGADRAQSVFGLEEHLRRLEFEESWVVGDKKTEDDDENEDDRFAKFLRGSFGWPGS